MRISFSFVAIVFSDVSKLRSNIFSLVQGSDRHLTEAEIENSLGSNLCRCTGYRPILEAFKSLAVDADANTLNKIKDIEDVSEQICPKSGKTCGGVCGINEEWCLVNMDNISTPDLPKKISLADGRLWFTVADVRSIFTALDDAGYDSYMLVAGNTAKGNLGLLCYRIIKLVRTETGVLYVLIKLILHYRSPSIIILSEGASRHKRCEGAGHTLLGHQLGARSQHDAD